MSTENPAGAAGDPAAAGAGARPDGGAPPGGTPNPGGGDPSKGETVEYWKGEAKKAFAERDRARQAFLESDEGKALVAAKQAQEKAAEEAALKRGEVEKLYGEAKTRAERLEAEKRDLEAKHQAEITERDRKVKLNTARSQLEAAYRAAGGLDPETFLTLAAPAIDKGEVAVGDDGKVTGLEEVIKKQMEARPYLFKRVGSPTRQSTGGTVNPPKGAGLAAIRSAWQERREKARGGR